ncbi:outer membrane beta-barrel protein [Sediminibacterium ginsengisoli]|uniref:Outer membrane protein beta-barrel domain-containing protein n=1 Tax=Sediminibacterium ginsengisoli TaxID=413434 RepID=A0A1T4LXI5_9BACT|nr:outer membrane beta-barrel protein [Sediminibacterium ginsengisoli]SJZ59402.1 Outer membrane protein beta-barrel domain-containing protein [Sediminibacterium ginsengisoli]
MKRALGLMAAMLVAGAGFAQTDTTTGKSDTMRVGNFIIIKKNKDNNTDKKKDKGEDNSVWKDWDRDFSVRIQRKPYKRTNISTNWFIFDLGFANFRDNTDYAAAQAGGYFKVLRTVDGPVDKNSFRLNTGKSSNVNIWLFMQKLNVIKHVVNLKYGLGLEMYNFRYDSRLSYRRDPVPYVYNDSISFSKNKLYVGYLTVPLMVNINASPNKRNGFSISGGISAGYLLSSRNKQISAERGKQKNNGNFDLEPWRLATVAEVGLGPVRLYGSYSLNRLHKESTHLEQYPYTVGIRFSNW